jgi:hypothetical protein
MPLPLNEITGLLRPVSFAAKANHLSVGVSRQRRKLPESDSFLLEIIEEKAKHSSRIDAALKARTPCFYGVRNIVYAAVEDRVAETPGYNLLHGIGWSPTSRRSIPTHGLVFHVG